MDINSITENLFNKSYLLLREELYWCQKHIDDNNETPNYNSSRAQKLRSESDSSLLSPGWMRFNIWLDNEKQKA